MNIFKNKVDIYIAVSNATKNKILNKTNFNEEKIKVLYNYVDLEKFRKIEIEKVFEFREKY
jgi:glycosyltransferase involved in cell wall biosynthesis